KLELEAGSRPLNFFDSWSFGFQFIQKRVCGGLQIRKGMSRPRSDRQHPLTDILIRILITVQSTRSLLVVDERLGQPRRPRSGSDGIEHGKRKSVVTLLADSRPGHIETRHLYTILKHDASFPVECYGIYSWPRNRLALHQTAEVFHHPCAGRRRLKIAGN